MKKWLWRTLGLLNVGLAYIGMITPGIPTTTFLLLALWCFSKGSPALHQWVYTHPRFGVYVRDWTDRRIYPLRAKYLMIGCCVVSLLWMFLAGVSVVGIVATSAFMLFWIVWAWRYPSSHAEYEYRKAHHKKIGWVR